MTVFRREDNRRVAVAVITIRIGATFKQVFRYPRSSCDRGAMKNIAVIRAKPRTRFKQNVVDSDQPFFCLGSYSRVEAKQLLHAGHCENTPAAAAVTMVGIGAGSKGLAYRVSVKIVDRRLQLRLRGAELHARLGR
jgi:hypothetical protein